MQHLPFQPIRQTLYSARELLDGYDSSDARSLERMHDQRIYYFFVNEGRAAPKSYFASMMQALHDNSMNQALEEELANWKRVVGIMGDHALERNSPAYRQVAELARHLARKDVLIATGGGPGAMEAAHFGAALATSTEENFEKSLAQLGAQPTLPPNLSDLLSNSGVYDPLILEAYHRWWKPAIDLTLHMGGEFQPSLSFPTWYYGHEPFTPFATKIAKYFQNSIREDGLVMVCKSGVVFTEGRAGTVQEIFQDTTRNFYRGSNENFSPMVFLGTEYWLEKYPVIPLLKAMFTQVDFEKYILLTDSFEQAANFLLGFPV